MFQICIKKYTSWNKQFVSYIVARTSYIQWDDDVCFVLDQHVELDIYSASSLEQQSAGRHVAPLGHIILISSQPVFCSCFLTLHA